MMDGKRSEVFTLYRQIQTLRDDVEKVRPEDADKPGRPGSGITSFIVLFNSLLQRTKNLLSDDPQALKSIDEIKSVQQIKEILAATYHKKAKFQILLGTGSLLATLELYLRPAVEVPSMKIGREGIFFAGHYFDAIQHATEILAEAKKSIVIIDGYINRDVLKMLTSKGPTVQVRILTKSWSDALDVAASTFNKQYGGLSIRLSEAFHDRFLILDDTDIYHFGASIKDLGHRGFMFSRIEEPTVIEMVLKKFDEEWKQATIKVP